MKKTNFETFFFIFYIIVDICILNFSFFLAFILRFKGYGILYYITFYEELILFSNIVWISILFFYQPYNLERFSSELQTLRKTIIAVFFHALLITSFIIILKNYNYSRITLFLFYLTLPTFLCVWKLVLLYLIRRYRIKGYNQYRIIVMGWSHSSEKIIKFFKKRDDLGIVVKGIFDDKYANGKEIKTYEEGFELMNEKQVDEIYCSLPPVSQKMLERIMKITDTTILKLKIITDFSYITTRKLNCEFYNTIPVIKLSELPLDSIKNKVIKRILDVVCSFFVIILVLSWLIPLLGIWIKLESKGPIFFVQKRDGLKKYHFHCFKFRSMKMNLEAHTKQAVKNDKRVTKLGRILRKTSIDEIPQFINVFLGDMSIVGPRPHPIPLNEKFRPIIKKFDNRHIIKPGITGLAQIKGYRGETQKTYDMANRVRLDRFYIENWSILLDINIILKTTLTFFKKNKKAY